MECSTLPHGTNVQATLDATGPSDTIRPSGVKQTQCAELNLPTAKIVCTRKAHSRAANMRCLHDSTVNTPRGLSTMAYATGMAVVCMTSPPKTDGYVAPDGNKPDPQQPIDPANA